MKSVQFMLLTIAVLGGWLATFNSTFAQTWSRVSAVSASSISISADGSKIMAAVYGGGIYVSTNFGVSWTLTTAPSTNWTAIASSFDGNKIIATSYTGGIYISTNAGITWTNSETNAPGQYRILAVSSSDGNKLAVADYFAVSTSTDSGVSWISNPVSSQKWVSLISSADGSKLAIASYLTLYISTNSGVQWRLITNVPTGSDAIAGAADGNKLATAASHGGIYTSVDSGATWILTSAPILTNPLTSYWQAITSSSDGRKLAATIFNGGIYTSTDFGATWTSNNVPAENWSGIASSADGSILAAASTAGIWVLQTTPTPQLNIAPTDSNLKLSWIVPSTNFVLQQSFDLSSWSDVTNTPALNLTNLQDEVVLSPTNSGGFYRLESR